MENYQLEIMISELKAEIADVRAMLELETRNLLSRSEVEDIVSQAIRRHNEMFHQEGY